MAEVRTIFPSGPARRRASGLSATTQDPEPRLQAEIKRQFGYVATPQTIETNVFLLCSVKYPGRIDSKAAPQPWTIQTLNKYHDLPGFVKNWENLLQTPIIDQTELTNRYNLTSVWPPNGYAALRVGTKIETNAHWTNSASNWFPARKMLNFLVVQKAKN